jgi:tetratricopeptide (TPR) repeat protein
MRARREIIPFFVLLTSVVFFAPTAQAAGGKDQHAQCDYSNDPKLRIAACTALIESGRQTRRQLSAALNNRGNGYHDLGQHARAIEDYDQSIRLEPNDADTLYNRGNAYQALDQRARAIEDYDRAIRLNPGHVLAWNNRGNAYHDLGQYARAVEDLDQAIRLNPKLSIAFNNRGNGYYGLGQYARAIEDYDRALRLNSGDASVLKNRSHAKERLGDQAGARADRELAMKLEQRDTPGSSSTDGTGGTAASLDHAGCKPVAGEWSWFVGGVVTISDDGALAWRPESAGAVGATGSWRCENGQFTFAWNNGFVDTLRLTDGDKVLRGRNAQGVAVSGIRR